MLEYLGANLSLANFDFGSYIASLTKTDFRNIGALIRSKEFLSPEIVIYVSKPNIRHALNIAAMFGLVLQGTTYIA